MYEQDRYSRGLGWIWALVVLIVVLLLLFGALRSGLFWNKPQDDLVYIACDDTYGKDQCTCFAGILRMQLTRDAHDKYVENLKEVRRHYRYFDGRLAENSFTGRDADVCVDASDICKVSVCEPGYTLPPDNYGIDGLPQGNFGIDGALPPQGPGRPYVSQPGPLEQVP